MRRESIRLTRCWSAESRSPLRPMRAPRRLLLLVVGAGDVDLGGLARMDGDGRPVAHQPDQLLEDLLARLRAPPARPRPPGSPRARCRATRVRMPPRPALAARGPIRGGRRAAASRSRPGGRGPPRSRPATVAAAIAAARRGRRDPGRGRREGPAARAWCAPVSASSRSSAERPLRPPGADGSIGLPGPVRGATPARRAGGRGRRRSSRGGRSSSAVRSPKLRSRPVEAAPSRGRRRDQPPRSSAEAAILARRRRGQRHGGGRIPSGCRAAQRGTRRGHDACRLGAHAQDAAAARR